MEDNLTIENIEKALELIKENDVPRIFEDEYSIVECGMLGPKKVTLKAKGMEVIKNFIDLGNKELDEKGFIDFYGIKIVRS